ncbi:MAG: AlpA family transcriptional regulator [Pseudomonadota bacterium]
MAEAAKTSNSRLIRIGEVSQKTGMARSGIYAAIAEGKFPAPVKISHRCSAWPESEVDAWIVERIEERNSQSRCLAQGGIAL